MAENKTIARTIEDSLEEEPDPSITVLFSNNDMIHRCLRLPAVATVGPPNHDVPGIHAGTNAAESKRNLITWLDDVVMASTGIDPRVEDHSRNKVPGKYTQLRQNELLKIQKALSGLDQWTYECIHHQLSCGQFFITTSGGRGGTSEECILIGPFQKTF